MDQGVSFADVQRLNALLVSVAEQSKRNFTALVEPLGLPVPVARAVLMLEEPLPMRDLADQLACDRSYITGIADQLEERDLVHRVPGKDRRVKLLELTPDGTALRNHLKQEISQRSPLINILDAEQRHTLETLLLTLLGTENKNSH